jgi:hypothetical protein
VSDPTPAERADAEAEALLDMDGRRERLEQVAADIRSGKVRPVDHATARARIAAVAAPGAGTPGAGCG